MKALDFLSILVLFVLTSCSSISVYSDYEKNTDFSQFKTFAFYKTGIDKVPISDFDKKRILNAIEANMISKGFTLSESPDLLINISTKEYQQVDYYSGYYGWGWGPYYGGYPYWGGYYSYPYSYPAGTLFIDLINAKTNQLVWQGEGNGYLVKGGAEKEARINEFVTKILTQYPPAVKKK